MSTASPAPGLLFTAFEPSGDEHAAPVIAELRRRRPDLTIYALGGPLMAAAGAELIESSTDNAVMLQGTVTQAVSHYQRVGRLGQWLEGRRIAALVPVDSPAANWSICALLRRRQPQARIVHLVAPQLWAWAPWRIRKLRRLSDHVLCLLPFEAQWFAARDMPATFVGHPVFDPQLHQPPPPLADAPAGAVKLALLPGSRMGEIDANLLTMLQVTAQLQQRHPGLAAVVSARDVRGAEKVNAVIDRARQQKQAIGPVTVRHGQTEAVIAWADVVLATSGTVTLHIVAQRKPMVVFYNTSKLLVQLLARWLVHTRTFTLPNLISESLGLGRAVPEYVPHFRQVDPLVAEMDRLISQPQSRAEQTDRLAHIAQTFANKHYAQESAEKILALLEAAAD
ncbi:MAG: hypothetical protein WD042_07410 [Phycisphaeraceae bacterium]